MHHRATFNTTLLATAAAVLLISGCGRDDNRTAGQQLDSAIAKTEQKTEQAKAEVKSEIAQAKAGTEAATAKAADALRNTSNQVVSKVEDAGITASVNAELAKDPGLSALRINVDTTNGRVLLRGTAPDAKARDRATRLATAVKGVTQVDNQLEVRG